MEHIQSTTPFGRRAVTLGQIAAQMQAGEAMERAGKAGSNFAGAINKWALFRTLTLVKDRLGVSDRSLSVLNALLSFHPETALTLPVLPKATGVNGNTEGQGGHVNASCDLIVFPSNRALSLRAHGMAEKTLRRHVAALIDAGLIFRRDSPNGKRYARKGDSGGARFSDAFGFDLTPLITRAAEFETLAEHLRQAQKALRMIKERISLYRRDIAKLIACGLDEGLPGPWETYRQRFMGLVTPLRRLRDPAKIEALAAELASLRNDVNNTLEMHIKTQIVTGNDGHNDQHQSNSNSKWPLDSEPASKEVGVKLEPNAETIRPPTPVMPLQGHKPVLIEEPPQFALSMVLAACPDVADYATSGPIRQWPAFISAVQVLRPMLGISPDAWRDAVEVMGEAHAAMVVASILQRGEHSSEAEITPGATPGSTIITVNGSPAIKSPGGYLRALTQKAREDKFALGPMLMALMGQRLKAQRGRGWG
ncbi:MAG: replication initiation protein RepC [Hyphomicrobiales bacterium]|nr:replication initiation protein RepC [Hyphomicrobiales bacterium]MDE2114289.1 replication initiation protein RepC [Hyphomicrobiales bacterium]